MDDIVATRLWITTRIKLHDANVSINFNMSIREIVDILNLPYLPTDQTLSDVLSGQEDLISLLWVIIMAPWFGTPYSLFSLT